MTSTTTEAPTRQLLTHSSMACAKTCLRKYWYSYQLGLRPERESGPLRFGNSYHLGLEMLAKGESVEATVAAIRANYDDTPLWVYDDDGGIDAWMVECEKVVRLVCGYHWRWQNDPLETVQAEWRFDLPIVNPDGGGESRTFRAAGKLDRLVTLGDGRLAVHEYKTTSEDLDPSGDYWKRLLIDQQISHYMLSARASGFDVQTVLYDVVRKPTIRPHNLTKAEQKAFASLGEWFGEKFEPAAVDHETPAMYGARLNADIAERPDYYYARREIPRLESDLEQFKAELWQIAKHLLDCQNHGRWFRNTGACHSFFGRCEFFDICTQGLDVTKHTPSGFVRVTDLHPELGNSL